MFTILLTFLTSIITDHNDGAIMALFLIGLVIDITLTCMYTWVARCIEKLAIKKGHQRSRTYYYATRTTWLGGLIYALRLPDLQKAPEANEAPAEEPVEV